ncbi:MAG TPA: outer membrane beta-barrel protein [Flavobacteriales bacterium]|nr:outer membrane beta-barrel protein [Flavobacteriales bacterium]
MKTLFMACAMLMGYILPAQTDSSAKQSTFAGMDISWINGQNRQRNFPVTLTDKKGETILTGTAYVDTYYNYNFANPVDNTQTISSSIGRHNEFQVNLASMGIETNYKNAIGRVWLQAGAMQHIIQELDGSIYRGRNSGTGNLKFIREAAAGYHFNCWNGINVEAGIFMSYIGLESYILQDNWNYQRSMPCDFTPFYFQGARIQLFPLLTLKTEIWILNGWQTYNSFSKSPGLGSSTYWRPNENTQLVANFYLGRDTQNPDTLGNQSNRLRFHHDNSVVLRYYKNPHAKGISQMAFSLNSHYGFQKGVDKGDSITPQQHFMYGISTANRVWFNKNKLGLTLRADYISNGGNYLAFSPSPVSPNDYTNAFYSNYFKPIQIFQATATFDVMPNEFVTFRVEYGYRQANIPYFAGQGGTTSPSGWANGPLTFNQWKPDLRNKENRITFVVNFRI